MYESTWLTDWLAERMDKWKDRCLPVCDLNMANIEDAVTEKLCGGDDFFSPFDYHF